MLRVTQLCSHDNNEPTNDIDCTLASDQSSGSDDEHSSSDVSYLPSMCLLLTKFRTDHPRHEYNSP